jgi:hypothetical protein
MATAVHKAKRERPEDGGIVWHEKWNAFECYGCGEFTEIRDRHKRTPDKLAEMQEFLIIDHTECWLYDDPKMAADARKYRSEKKRRENLKARAGAVLDCSLYLRRGR